MGLKRVTAIIEVVYPADDTRSLETLRDVTQGALAEGVLEQNGQLVAFWVTGLSIDPDPEPEAPEVPVPSLPPGAEG